MKGLLLGKRNPLWRFFASLKGASILLGALLALTILAGLLPQFPREWMSPASEWWWAALRERYHLLYPLRSVGLFTFFYSPLFWGMLALVLVGVLVCNLGRLRTRQSSALGHLSLLALALGLGWTALGRSWQLVGPVPVGESFQVGGEKVRLADFQTHALRGQPVGYTARLETEGGRPVSISLGAPALIAGRWLVFDSYGEAWRVSFARADGTPLKAKLQGQEHTGEVNLTFPRRGASHTLEIPDADLRLVLTLQPQGLFVEAFRLESGESLGEGFAKSGKAYTLKDSEGREVQVAFASSRYVVFRLVSDPGLPLFLLGGVLFLAGTILEFISSARREGR